MVKIEFLGPINLPDKSLDVASLKELKALLLKDELLKEWLLNCAVAVNDQIVKSLDIKLKDGDTVSLLPPVCGG